MNDNLVTTLLHKQLTGQLESADKQLLLDWLAHSSENQETKEDIAHIWDLSKNYTPAFTPNVDKSFEKFSQRIKSDNNGSPQQKEAEVIKLRTPRMWLRYAAIGIVAIAAVFVWRLTQYYNVTDLMVSTIEDEIIQVTLADETLVWLNEKSELSYPDKFRGKERVVSLTGQAFFDVTENQNKPFIINGGSAYVKVLGTSFSVTTDNDNGLMEVEVKDGTVSINPVGSEEELVISKNEKGYYDTINKKFLDKELLSVSNADYFVTNSYRFEDSKYSFVFKILADVYEVEFELASEELNDCKLTSPIEFDKDNINEMIQTLEQVYAHRNLKINRISDSRYLIESDPCN